MLILWIEFVKVEGGGEKKELKYLDFIQVGAFYMIVSFSSLYNYAKESSGPLKPGVKIVEATVRTAIEPVCRKFCDISLELLELVDHKVFLFSCLVIFFLKSQ